ncbi:MAG: hypothetical protein AAF517_06440 [Planctomycetota bacterium]
MSLKSGKRRWVVVVLGVAVIATAIASFGPLRERYWLWRLRHGTAAERERAAAQLTEHDVEDAVPILVELLVASDEDDVAIDIQRNRASVEVADTYVVQALVVFGERAVAQLVNVVKSRRAGCHSAIHVLGKIGPEAGAAVPELEALLETDLVPSDMSATQRVARSLLTIEALKQIRPTETK